MRQSTGNRTGLPGRNLLNPPYAIDNSDGPLYANTIWPDLPQYGGYSHYDLHNLFASGMITATRSALLTRSPEKRPFIISRSTFAGSGNKTGHWTGDNASSWKNYTVSIKQNMEFASIYQVPTVGADVCGFNLDTTETLCARWATLGAFYPFYRNHADISAKEQEFYLWPLVTAAAQGAIKTRMQLIDYFYTNFHYQTLDGIPRTILPLFYVYPSDTNTLEDELQFFFGLSLMVSPVTEENSTSVTFYMPKDTFYDFFTGEKVLGQGATVTRDNVNFTEIPVHVRGGSIVPLRVDGANNTKLLRELDFELVVAPDADGNASGRLFLDDGESLKPSATSDITFDYNSETDILSMNGTFGYSTASIVQKATLLGAGGANTTNSTSGRVGKVVLLNKPLTGEFTASLN
jgi:alpha-glucosidase